MTDLNRLFAAVRALSPQADLRFVQVPDHPDMWVARVSVGAVILVETGGGLPDFVIHEATRRLETMVQRIRRAVHPDA